jgi:regulator of RNase E activity RraA
MVGSEFVEREDWFKYILTMPEPRIAVLQDVDSRPGAGAFWDEDHVRIHLRLGCIGAVTNGAVRDLPAIRSTGFYLFAGNLTVAHGYAHIIDMGHPVEVANMVIHPGDLIHGDVHGVVNIPTEIAERLPGTASQILEGRRQVAAFCSSQEFSLDRLMALLKDLE